MGKYFESIIGGLFVTAAIIADFLQITHPYNLSSWLVDFSLPTILVIVIVAGFYLLIAIAASVLVKKLIRSTPPQS